MLSDIDYKIINLPKILDERGNLTFLENENQIPFSIERLFWIYDVPGGACRGGHAFYKQQEIIIALSGCFDVVVNNGQNKFETITLNRPYYGLYISPMTWRHIENFSTNALALHLSSHKFMESDYIRDFNIFKNIKDNNVSNHL